METIKAEVVHQELYDMYLGYVAILIAEAGSKKVAMSSDMLISAPHDHFIENRNISINKLPYTYQERIKLEDPLVFQLLPFGVLIHDKWGEVANDKIFGGIQ